MIDDIVLGKKESIERCIRRIREYYARPSDLPFEEDYLRRDAIAMNIQRAAELCIDLANHVVKARKLGIPKDSRASFTMLAREGLIPKELSKLLEGMVGFRNVLIHDYRELDIEVMKDVIEHRLDDLVAFTVRVMEIE
jgi:uncharacterized protein YutE (UPF0331/DUF86 family)